ncbi:hypothetical protein ABKV19_024231 [Rosa sericea]
MLGCIVFVVLGFRIALLSNLLKLLWIFVIGFCFQIARRGGRERGAPIRFSRSGRNFWVFCFSHFYQKHISLAAAIVAAVRSVSSLLVCIIGLQLLFPGITK